MPQQAAQLAEVLGREVHSTDVPPEVVREQMLASGGTPEAIDTMMLGFSYARAGRNAVLTDDVPRILGRPAITFRDWAHRNWPAFP